MDNRVVSRGAFRGVSFHAPVDFGTAKATFLRDMRPLSPRRRSATCSPQKQDYSRNSAPHHRVLPRLQTSMSGDQVVPPITGIYDVMLGVSTQADLEQCVRHYQQFGFGEPSHDGSLSAEKAENLYGHKSALTAVRLPHQDADHGLLRIVLWESLKNDGVWPFARLKAAGSRWTTALTVDALNVYQHVRNAQASEGILDQKMFATVGALQTTSRSWYSVSPTGDVFYKPEKDEPPFVGKQPSLHEMLVSGNVTGKQVLFTRHDYHLENYGRVNESAHFPTSQFTHCAIVPKAGTSPDLFKFYSETLGLMEAGSTEGRGDKPASQAMFDSVEDDVAQTILIDDPRSSLDIAKCRSGRLFVRAFASETSLKEDVFEESCPGCPGVTLYTYRVSDVFEYQGKVASSAATRVSDVIENEFGERSFSFIAPDGYWWQLIER